MAIVGGLMMAGFIAGAVGGAMKNNTEEQINKDCDSWINARKDYVNTLQQWNDIMDKQNYDLQEIQEFNKQVVTQFDNYKGRLADINDGFRKKISITIITLLIFILSIITLLLFRFLKIGDKVWNLFN